MPHTAATLQGLYQCRERGVCRARTWLASTRSRAAAQRSASMKDSTQWPSSSCRPRLLNVLPTVLVFSTCAADGMFVRWSKNSTGGPRASPIAKSVDVITSKLTSKNLNAIDAA